MIIHVIMRKPNSIIVLLYVFHIIHPQKQKRSAQSFCFWGEHSKGLSNQADVELDMINAISAADIAFIHERTHLLVLCCSHLCISISTRKTNMFVFLVLMLMRKWEQHKTKKWVRSSAYAYAYVAGVLTCLCLCIVNLSCQVHKLLWIDWMLSTNQIFHSESDI